ncbi:MAG: carboxylating nicotinate-nucleotide diphosphorylase [Gammaproteobacteria bacterium]|nr:carboxylating nicotinate-nucleotide diphosphorylase [Gammaproteobacteria bacterium]
MLSIPPDLKNTVSRALAEDIGSGDINAQLMPAAAEANARVITRESAILCGTPWFDEVFYQLDKKAEITWRTNDGEAISSGQELCSLHGPVRALLSGERCALNFLQTLSGTASKVQRYVQLIKGTGVTLLDTRKTLPGLRSAQKYAVCCGGGKNHRQGLYDAFLIKENHILAAGSISRAVTAARALAPALPVEVETENISELQEALAAGADSVLLDNFSSAQLREAVALTQRRCKLEASGGITEENLRTVAETGVDYISIGALTKDVRAVDFSMRLGSIRAK